MRVCLFIVTAVLEPRVINCGELLFGDAVALAPVDSVKKLW